MDITYYVENPRRGIDGCPVTLQVHSEGVSSPFTYQVETFFITEGRTVTDLSPESQEEDHSEAAIGMRSSELVRVTERQADGQITREGVYLFYQETLFIVHEQGFSLRDAHRIVSSSVWSIDDE